MHRFTSPTPRSRSVLVSLFVSSWEIECCAPPPVVGDDCSWKVTFWPASAGVAEAALVADHDVREHDGEDLVVLDGAVVALWFRGHELRPREAVVSGVLFGTAHGGVAPDHLPPVRGRVHRVRLAREEFVAVEAERGRFLERVPGSLRLTDVRESPRWFTRSTFETGIAGVDETGVLIDVEVRPASLPADPPPS